MGDTMGQSVLICIDPILAELHGFSLSIESLIKSTEHALNVTQGKKQHKAK